MYNSILTLDHERRAIPPIPYSRVGQFFKRRDVALYSRTPTAVVFKDQPPSHLRTDCSPINLNIDFSDDCNRIGLSIVSDFKIIWLGELDLANIHSPIGFIVGWINKIKRLTPLASMTIGLYDYRFDHDNQKNNDLLRNPRAQEIRAFLADKYNGKCVYCDQPGREIEHIIPKCKSGGNLLTNLALSCRPCNQKKADKPLTDFIGIEQASKIWKSAQEHPLIAGKISSQMALDVFTELSRRYQEITIIPATKAQKLYNLNKFGCFCKPQRISIQSAYLGEGKPMTQVSQRPLTITSRHSLND